MFEDPNTGMNYCETIQLLFNPQKKSKTAIELKAQAQDY